MFFSQILIRKKGRRGNWQKDNSYNHQPMRSSSQITNSEVMCQNRQSLRDSPEKNDDLNEKININSKSLAIELLIKYSPSNQK